MHMPPDSDTVSIPEDVTIPRLKEELYQARSQFAAASARETAALRDRDRARHEYEALRAEVEATHALLCEAGICAGRDLEKRVRELIDDANTRDEEANTATSDAARLDAENRTLKRALRVALKGGKHFATVAALLVQEGDDDA